MTAQVQAVLATLRADRSRAWDRAREHESARARRRRAGAASVFASRHHRDLVVARVRRELALVREQMERVA